jgi:hypothetical protein
MVRFSSLDPPPEAPPSFPFAEWDEMRSPHALDEVLFPLEGAPLPLVGIDVVDSLPLASRSFFPWDVRPEDVLSVLLLRRADRAEDAARADVGTGVDNLSGSDDVPREMFIRYVDDPYDGIVFNGGRGVVGLMPPLLLLLLLCRLVAMMVLLSSTAAADVTVLDGDDGGEGRATRSLLVGIAAGAPARFLNDVWVTGRLDLDDDDSRRSVADSILSNLDLFCSTLLPLVPISTSTSTGVR